MAKLAVESMANYYTILGLQTEGVRVIWGRTSLPNTLIYSVTTYVQRTVAERKVPLFLKVVIKTTPSSSSQSRL